MKHRLKILLLATSSLTLISGGSVMAQNRDNNSPNPLDSIPKIQSSSEVKTDPASLEQRLQMRKNERKAKLPLADERRIKQKCKASQGKVSSLSGRIKGIETSRTQVYGNTVDRLIKLSTKLKEKGLNTTQLESQIAELVIKINKFNTDLTAYKQVISDLTAVDCVNDPAAFQASLEAARTARETVANDGAAIRSYLLVTIKPTLTGLRAQLDDKETEGDS